MDYDFMERIVKTNLTNGNNVLIYGIRIRKDGF